VTISFLVVLGGMLITQNLSYLPSGLSPNLSKQVTASPS
jgi:hypothetical protein